MKFWIKSIYKWLLDTFSPPHNEVLTKERAKARFARKQLKVEKEKWSKEN